MSNALVYDSLLVRYLTRELDERLSGRRLRGVRMDSEHRRVTLELDDERLVWDLHPTRGWLRLLPANLPQEAAEGWGGRTVRTQRRPRVRRVHASPDERWLVLELDPGGPDRAARLVVELMTNQWNTLALAPDGTILSALRTRETGGRELRSGRRYRAPTGTPLPPLGEELPDPGNGEAARDGVPAPVALERWLALLADIPPEGRRKVLVRSVAWMSGVNAGPVLGDAARAGASGEETLREAWERYVAVAGLPPQRAHVLPVRGGQPYPLPLPGLEGRPVTSLLAAFDVALAGTASVVAPEVRGALEERLERVRRKARRLRGEAEEAPGRAAALRRRADLLMAQLHRVEKGATGAQLDDFEGGSLTVDLDPALSPVENAEALYDRAGKRERAAERLPERVREAVAEQNRLESFLEALESEDADPEEVEKWLREVRPGPDSGGPAAERLPYRTYRSSGGLEIRVGRTSRANDDLTFHHSAPDDIWLHARDAAGAHVILRWDDREQNPPRRDLLEAAVLAALSSRARTSGTVPVDWTRRKYVRKPRKAPPGAVVPDRVGTVFVEPDPAVRARLEEE